MRQEWEANGHAWDRVAEWLTQMEPAPRWILRRRILSIRSDWTQRFETAAAIPLPCLAVRWPTPVCSASP
jgi:hypothetical protein